jgi:hypothetical protein
LSPPLSYIRGGHETVRRARRDTGSLKHLQLGLGETANLPAQGPNEVSW